MAFKENMKSLRKVLDLTQAQAAEKTGLKKHNIGAYEEGRSEPSFEDLIKITTAYDIKKEDLHAFLYEEYNVLTEKTS